MQNFVCINANQVPLSSRHPSRNTLIKFQTKSSYLSPKYTKSGLINRYKSCVALNMDMLSQKDTNK